MTKRVRLQTEYMVTQKTRVIVHGVPMDITKDRVGGLFSLNNK